MSLAFNYSTFDGIFDSFTSPVRERAVPVVNGMAHVQQRGTGAEARFYLRLRSGMSSVKYQKLDRSQMLALAEALIDIAQEEENP